MKEIEKKEEESTSKPNLAVIIGLCCAVLTVAQGLCTLYHVEIAINVLIDIISLALTVLVSLKLVKTDKIGSVSDIMSDIKSDLMDGIKDDKDTNHDAIVVVSKTAKKSSGESSDEQVKPTRRVRCKTSVDASLQQITPKDNTSDE